MHLNESVVAEVCLAALTPSEAPDVSNRPMVGHTRSK